MQMMADENPTPPHHLPNQSLAVVPEPGGWRPKEYQAKMDESPVCERTLTEVLDSRSSSGGTDGSRRLPAKRTKKGQHGAAVDEEVVLMRTIGKTLERMAAGAQRQEEHHAYLSVFSQNQIQEPDRQDLTRLETDYKDESPL
ncbi:unnamed protein product [Boreogadus saida]